MNITNRPKSKKAVAGPKPLIVNGYNNFSRVMYYALLGIITEVVSDREKEKKENLKKNPNYAQKTEKFSDTKIAEDIYNKLGKLYPESTFNVVILNLVGGAYQFANNKEDKTAYISVTSGNRVYMIFRYKD